MRRLLFIGFAPLFFGALFGQQPDTTPRFQIADIHTSPPSSSPRQFMRSGFYKGGRYEVRSATMVDLVGLAYGVDSDKVLSGPSWIETDRFDTIAIAPPNSTQDAVKGMLQALLADRFKLVVHIDKKEMPSYALIAGKQPKLKEADGSGDTGCTFQVQNGGPGTPDGGPPSPPSLTFKCGNMTMAALAEYMHTMPAGPQFLGNNPLVDDTGLKGSWNFEFHFTLPNGPIAAGGTSNALFDAVDKQLGLKLEPRKVPIPVIFVDSVNEKPTDNPPGVMEKLPVAPTEFEVANIKPSDPSMNEQNRGNPFLPGGRLDLRGMTLKQLIFIAWDTTPDKIVGGPKSLDEDKYDILAKAPTTSLTVSGTNGPGNQPPVDIDALRLMLRRLLIDRFKLATHSEDRPAQAYTLVAAKPKLKKAADPLARTGYKEGPGPDGKDPRKDAPMLGRLVTCTNMSMAQLAAVLPGIAPGYFQNASTTVIDATGVEGSFDFTLSFSGAGILNGGGGGRGGDSGPAPAAAAGQASDPGGGITLFDAMEKQIGIKMEMQKRPMPVLVIDHIEPKPTDN